MIGFWVVNLVVPGEPQELKINTPSGTWTIDKNDFYGKSLAAMREGQCATTYAIEHPVSMDDGAAKCDEALEEMTPLMLGASYVTGLSVTAKKSLPYSDVQIMQPSDHWPRERAMGHGNPVVNTQLEFATALEAFVANWPSAGQSEKALLLIHHWLDALGCWSFEDLYLSATTLLQIVAATEEGIQRRRRTYFEGVTDASSRVGISPLSRDFKDMRNNLVHRGTLLGAPFHGTSIRDCAVIAADVLNWFDEYVHATLRLGVVQRKRHSANDFLGLNAYSLP